MKVFDLRHRWGPPDQHGATITRTCRACGLTQSMEILIRDDLIDALAASLRVPNPFRAALVRS